MRAIWKAISVSRYKYYIQLNNNDPTVHDLGDAKVRLNSSKMNNHFSIEILLTPLPTPERPRVGLDIAPARKGMF